jgi:hypothetical protein
MWYFENDRSRSFNYVGEIKCQELTNVRKVKVKS